MRACVDVWQFGESLSFDELFCLVRVSDDEYGVVSLKYRLRKSGEKLRLAALIFFKTNEDSSNLAGHQRTQAALAKSRLVLNSALRVKEVANLPVLADKIDPVAWLEEEGYL